MGDRRRLIIRGPFRGYSGYDVTTRNLARAIARRGVELGLIDIPQWSPLKLKPDARDPGWTGWTGTSMRASFFTCARRLWRSSRRSTGTPT
jgi:hypothetical protein